MFFRNTLLKNNIIKNRRLLSTSSTSSILDKEFYLGLNWRKYLIGFGISFVGITGYTYRISFADSLGRQRVLGTPKHLRCGASSQYIQ